MSKYLISSSSGLSTSAGDCVISSSPAAAWFNSSSVISSVVSIACDASKGIWFDTSLISSEPKLGHEDIQGSSESVSPAALKSVIT